jgi:hypothetical protein
MKAFNVPLAIALLAMLLVRPPAQADDKADAVARAKAALALAQAQREREVKPASITPDHKPMPEGCYEDYSTAAAEAKKQGKSLVSFVGITCEDCPAIRDGLKDSCVFCHLAEWGGDKAKGVVVTDPAGGAWRFRKTDLDAGTYKAADIKRALATPPKVAKSGGKWVQQCNGQSCQMVWVPD